ncbi:MAG TPA: hypothetical protein DD723_07770 [Candidatus Omnitrophica bacterium]|nr:MAG: ATPase, histidine kinase-, DNA gyrase B-, and HSP90-like protein domain protein [Parcubacteria group bacterium GW2011_GWC2_45_7]OGW98314.1 MAG: hypothetical protein A2Z81_04240 [Omnitrophica WOR_2 bacterium GWA2_45_18]HBR15423.1 hypothetical protein [Candidatus Omnitrophota bacterium]
MSDQKTILLIDDEIDLQQLVKIALKSRKYTIETANNGLEGLTKLETVKPDLIILDMNMPKMGGLEFYQRICDTMNQPKYPVLVLTARANMEQLFKEFNIDGFMAKPFEIDELLEEVDTIINKKSGITKAINVSEGNQPSKICVAENDEQSFNKIGSACLSAGYMVNPARSGAEAIERISATVPDVALIKLGLMDISGDIVIGKLKRMAKTQDVKFILYTEQTADKTVITERISQKEGVDRFVTYSDAKQLVDTVNELLKI